MTESFTHFHTCTLSHLLLYGSGVDFQYLTFRLMDYDKDELEKNDNPIALVVLACQERERARRKGKRLNVKLYLISKLYERGYTKQKKKVRK